MKKTRIISLILALTMIFGAFSVLPVSAEETEAASVGVEILAQNVVYGEKVQIAYAVNVPLADAANVTVEYYLEDAPDKVYKAALLDTSVSDNVYKGTNPVFATLGFHADNFTDVVYATAYVGDKAPENAVYKKYSVAEYFYARLYKDGFIDKAAEESNDGDRANLYLSMIDYGKYAQKVLVNNKGGNETLITDYCYLFAADETVTINGAKSGLFKPGTTVTFAASANVSAYILTDNSGKESEASKTYVTTAGYVAKVTPDLGTTPVITDFETEGLTTPTSDYISNRVGSTVVTDYTAQSAAASSFSLADDPTGAANKVLKITKVKSAGNISTDVFASNKNQEGNCVTFEMKMYSNKVQYDKTYIYFTYSSSNEATSGTKTGFGLYFYQPNGSEFRLQANNSNSTGVVTISSNLEAGTLPFNSWFTIKVEYYRDSHNAKVWINDECIVDGKCSNGFNAYDVFECVTITHDDERAGVDYFDDISVTLTSKEYVPETTVAE